ncbi:MAG: hypothetical protein PF630_02225 [Gammaproteobacteria bacterium]|nr:hypothetical protein [Gammaproteobacteria bacterium]
MPTISTRHIHLLIPELSDLLSAEAAHSLPRAIDEYTLTRIEPTAATSRLSACFRDQAPLAAWAWQYDGRPGLADQRAGRSPSAQAPAAYITRADPVCMQADMTRVHLLQVQDFDLQPAQADQLLDSLQPLFAEHAMQLRRGADAHACERWYVHSAKATPEAFPTPGSALGQPLEDVLANAAASQAFWLRLQSEAQMILHQHELNRRRADVGQSELNSLWFWGTGQLPPVPTAADWNSAILQSAELAGWCRWAGVATVEFAPRGDTDMQVAGAARQLLEWRIDRRRSQPDNSAALSSLLTRLRRDNPDALITLQSTADRCVQLQSRSSWSRLLQALSPRSAKPIPWRGGPRIWQQLLWLCGSDGVCR